MDTKLLVSELSNWSSSEDDGLFITLNAMTNDRIRFEEHLSKIAHKLNDFCYGRAYKRKEKRLNIIAGIEKGAINEKLHAHLIVSYKDNMTRTIQEVNAYIRKHWYALIASNDMFGSMVDVRNIGDKNERISYITKDTNYWLRNDSFNIIVL